MKKSEESLWYVYNTIKRNNICIIEMPEEKEKGIENIFKAVIAKNVSNFRREMDIQINEVQRTPNKLNMNQATPRHIITVKVKDRKIILKAT